MSKCLNLNKALLIAFNKFSEFLQTDTIRIVVVDSFRYSTMFCQETKMAIDWLQQILLKERHFGIIKISQIASIQKDKASIPKKIFADPK